MSTTTTIYPSADTKLSETNPTTNYGSEVFLKIGMAWTGDFVSSVLEFDVSSFTSPSDIVRAKLSIAVASEWGSSAETLTVARCTKPFDEASATWNEYSTGNSWDTAGGDAATTEQTYTSMQVGDTSGDQEVDIRELVVDAINRREGTLRIIIWMDHTPDGTAVANYGSVEHGTTSKRPKLEVTVADRRVWSDVAGDGSLDTVGNWAGPFPAALPTDSDIAIFASGKGNAITGSLACHSVYIGKNFAGSIEQTDGSGIDISASVFGNSQSITVASKKARVHFDDAGGKDIMIADTSSDGCKFTPLLGITNHNCTVASANKLEVEGDCNLVATGKQAKNITLSGTTTEVFCGRGTTLTLENGCDTITMHRSRCTCTGGTLAGRSGSVIAGGSICTMKNDTLDSGVQVYDGTLSLAGNTNATIDVEEITLWKRGKFDARTGVGSYSPSVDPALIMRGGSFVLDAGRTVDL